MSGTAAPRRRIPIKFRGEPAFVWKEIRPHAGAVLVVEIRGHSFTVGQAPQTTGEARIRALWWLADNALRWRVPNLVRRIR